MDMAHPTPVYAPHIYSTASHMVARSSDPTSPPVVIAKSNKQVAPTGTPSTPSPAPVPGPGHAGQFLKAEQHGGLRRSDLDQENPINQFHAWFTAASMPGAGVAHPEACTLATAQLPS